MGDVQCCVLKQEGNRVGVFYSVVYCNWREIERGSYRVLCTETGEK